MTRLQLKIATQTGQEWDEYTNNPASLAIDGSWYTMSVSYKPKTWNWWKAELATESVVKKVEIHLAYINSFEPNSYRVLKVFANKVCPI